jgi:hypothetical protein
MQQENRKMDECVHGTKNEGRIIALEDRAKRNDDDHISFVKAIEDIRDRLLARPAWTVVFMLMGLSSLCVGLLVKVLAP